jgi:hypothetical protein
LFVPQNYEGYGLSVAPQNRWKYEDDARHMSRSSDLLRLEASRARVSQSDLNTDGGVAQMAHVTLLWMLRWVKAEDGQVDMMGYIEHFYLNFIIFYILDPSDILIFCLDL